MTSRELMDAALAKTKNSQAWLARQMGWTPQNFNLRLNRNSIRADEFLALMDVLGVDVTFTPPEDVKATETQMKAAEAVIKQRLVTLHITDSEV